MQEWIAEVSKRIRAYEGLRLYKYRDTRRDEQFPSGVTTLGYGWALEISSHPKQIVEAAGGNWALVNGAPTAIDSLPSHAVSACISQPVAQSIFDGMLGGYIAAARSSLAPGVFDALDDARRFVIVDLTYNMGDGSLGWGGFGATHVIIGRAVAEKKASHLETAHASFNEAADHLQASDWAQQTGSRAVADIAMMRTSGWV